MKTFEQFNKKEMKGIPLMKYINYAMGEEYFIKVGGYIKLMSINNVWITTFSNEGFGIYYIKQWIINILHKDTSDDTFDNLKTRRILNNIKPSELKKILDILEDTEDMDLFLDSEELGLI